VIDGRACVPVSVSVASMSDELVATHRSQVLRVRRLAATAISAYDVREPRMQLVAHGENTTLRVIAGDSNREIRPTTGEIDGQYLLRVHRPSRHGRDVDSAMAIASELHWLVALRADTSLAVPEPVPTVDGALTTTATAEGVAGSRVCSLLRWMKGRNHHRSARPVHLYRLGGVLAQLHNHADRWRVPNGFVRIRWDHETYFGNTMVYGNVDAADAWTLLPANLQRDFARVAEDVGNVMRQLGQGPDVFGLIHADAHLDNVLFDGHETRLIDFDDCGFGYRIYDVAVALWELRHRDNFPSFKEAFVRGYTEHRPLPIDQLRHLDAFIAAREVAFGLWLVGMAQTRPAFREELHAEFGYIERSLGIVLSDRNRD
jgi:Ser/Thr protein kinase RdoA (MazF antagonist)